MVKSKFGSKEVQDCEFEDLQYLPGKELLTVDTSTFDSRGRIVKVGPTFILPTEYISKV
jgi:hypothetical protein